MSRLLSTVLLLLLLPLLLLPHSVQWRTQLQSHPPLDPPPPHVAAAALLVSLAPVSLHMCATDALPNELLFASATIDNGIMTCNAAIPLYPPPAPASATPHCSVIILQSFAKWTRLNKSSERGQRYDRSNCNGISGDCG